MSTGSGVPSLGSAGAKSTGVQPTVEPPNAPHKRLVDTVDNNSEKEQSNSSDTAGGKLAFEEAVEVDADLESENDPEISQIPPEVRRVVSLHDDTSLPTLTFRYFVLA